MKILAIDLGKSYGWCFKDDMDVEKGHGTCEDVLDWGRQFKKLIELWKPEVVVLSQTNRYPHWDSTRQMLFKAGVAFYICGKAGILGVEMNDMSARKIYLGKGYKKKEVQALYPDIQPDALDAWILAEGWHKLNN